jgi:hypothetical protein
MAPLWDRKGLEKKILSSRPTDRRSSSSSGAPMSLLLPHEILKPPDLFKAFNHYKLLKKLLKSSAAAAAAG